MPRLKKYWIHILIWSVLTIYLATAPALYARFFLQSGKPISVNNQLPAASNQVLASADRLDPIILRGQNLYSLWGWGFVKGEADLLNFERYLVLQSNNKTYFFPMESYKRPNLQTHFAYLNQDVSNAGFTVYLAKEPIEQGTYRLGILFKSKTTGDNYYMLTKKEIVRTANQLKLTIFNQSEQ